jgi:hypothetical protein
VFNSLIKDTFLKLYLIFRLLLSSDFIEDGKAKVQEWYLERSILLWIFLHVDTRCRSEIYDVFWITLKWMIDYKLYRMIR